MSAVDGIDEFAAQLAGILKEKNAAYGDSFARVPTILAMLYPSVPQEVLENILFTARILDKLGRIAQDPLGAGEDAYMDLAGYALLMANVQRLKRQAKAKTPAAQREALLRTAGKLAGAWTDEEAKEAFGSAEAPSEPNGRIKRDRLPDVRIVMGATAEWADAGQLSSGHSHGWYLHYPPENTFFNAYAGGFWTDARDATAFPTRRDAAEYCRKQGELNVRAAEPSEPPARIKRGMANAEVTQEPTGWYIVCFEGRDRQFFNDFGGFWIHDIRDATSFLSQEAAELCLRMREGSPHVVQTGSIVERPHTSHRVSGEGFWTRYARMRVTREELAKTAAKMRALRCPVDVCGLEHGHAGDCFPSPIGFYGQIRGASCE